jgi:hypothetical protein
MTSRALRMSSRILTDRSRVAGSTGGAYGADSALRAARPYNATLAPGAPRFSCEATRSSPPAVHGTTVPTSNANRGR